NPTQTFRLAAGEIPSTTQWMKACAWSPRDDAMLLLGVFRHGVGSWDRVALDEELKLSEKLAVAAAERCKDHAAQHLPTAKRPETLPKASHLDTRAYALLRQLDKAHHREAGAGGGGGRAAGSSRAARGSGAAAAAAAHGPLPGTRVRPGSAPGSSKPPRPPPVGAAGPGTGGGGARAAGGGGLSVEEAERLLGSQLMVIVRKVRTLQRKGGEMDKDLVLNKTRKYMATIGDRIGEVVAAQQADHAQPAQQQRQRLWAFVSSYTENSMSGEKLEDVYHKQ
ncbi:hypothetical protein N2152v2_002511, partial [Parachlorella kessleri]